MRCFRKKRILIGSPVRQHPQILEYFLYSLRNLSTEDLATAYYFVDDNDDARASQLLQEFRRDNPNPVWIEKVQPRGTFIRDETTHRWSPQLVWRVAAHKNRIIRHALDNGFDYLFLVDSDLVLNPKTLVQLLSAGKDVISEIFWTKWQPELPELPQVWGCDHYTLYSLEPGERITPEEAQIRQREWLSRLRKPGVYRVGGLGACTLIARCVLERGVDFSPLYNLSFWGEDRHFCIRAVACGFELFVDTHYPAFHIYRQAGLEEARAYLTAHGLTTPAQDKAQVKEILEQARQALVFYGTTECYRQDLKAGLELFSPELRNVIYREREKLKRDLDRELVITRTEVSDLLLQMESSQEAIVLANVKNYGILYNRNFLNEFRATVCLQKSADRWLVTHIDFQPKEKNFPKAFIWGQRVVKSQDNRITLAMVVRNEADRYLKLVLEQAKHMVDAAVIIDDGSTDGTPELIEEVLAGFPLKLIRNPEPLFEKNESTLRQWLWNETLETQPDWILCLDADELFEDKALNEIKKLINQPDFDYYSFRIYDFWDESHYREEPLWSAHFRYYVLLVRYQPHFKYVWSENPLHCGRFPSNITLLPGIQSPLRVKHLGWMNPHDRLKKYLRYMKLDPDGTWGVKEQYESILESFPRLIRWQD